MIDVKSPLTGENNCKLIKVIETEFIIKKYKELFNIDVKSYFKNLQHIYVYQCLDTSLKFFYPYNSTIAGDSKFYEELQKYKWYYRDDKWEQKFTLQYILSNNFKKVLEFGSGEGKFLDYLRNNNIDCYGIEINLNAIKISQMKGHIIFNGKKLDEISSNNKNMFDVICSFQVFEHIINPSFIIKELIKMLKDNGKIIISVPNNKSYIRYDEEGILNMPPHHFLLWDEDSLKKFGELNNLKIVKIIYEPLQKEHFGSYYKILFDRLIHFKLISKIFRKITYPLAKHILALFSNFINGQNILVVFEKNL